MGETGVAGGPASAFVMHAAAQTPPPEILDLEFFPSPPLKPAGPPPGAEVIDVDGLDLPDVVADVEFVRVEQPADPGLYTPLRKAVEDVAAHYSSDEQKRIVQSEFPVSDGCVRATGRLHPLLSIRDHSRVGWRRYWPMAPRTSRSLRECLLGATCLCIYIRVSPDRSGGGCLLMSVCTSSTSKST